MEATRLRWWAACATLVLLATAAPAAAQPRPKGGKPQGGAAPAAGAAAQPGAAAAAAQGKAQGAQTEPQSVTPKMQAGGGKIIVLDEEVIEGRIQKPEAFYILQRSNLNYKSLELQKSFVPDIIDTVKGSPF